MTRAQASPFPTTTVQLILITSINAGRFNLRERVRAPTRHVSHPAYSRIVPNPRSESDENISAGCICQFLLSLFFHERSRRFIPEFQIYYRKFNGGMKNREGTRGAKKVAAVKQREM